MPTEVTVSPTLGHAVLFTQGGVGTAPGYDFIDIRRSIEAASGFQEGVFNPTGWKVRENAGGPNMTIQVDANAGLAAVDGDSVAFQSRYVVAPHSGVVTLDVAAAHSTNPRVDMVVIQIRDNAHDASGFNDARVMILTGTPTAGATIDNLNGQASLPANALRLADVHVPAADTTISNAQIRDRRPWARGASYTYTRLAGNYTMAGTGMADIDATNIKPRLECSGRPLRAVLRSTAFNSAAGASFDFDVGIDSVAQGRRTRMGGLGYPANFQFPVALAWTFAPSPGSHLISLMWLVSGGTTTLAAAGTQALEFTVEELVNANASNGA